MSSVTTEKSSIMQSATDSDSGEKASRSDVNRPKLPKWTFMDGSRMRNLCAIADKEIIDDIASRLRRNFIFLSLDDKTIIDLALQFDVREYDEGEKIIEQGGATRRCSSPSENMQRMQYFIVIDGECEVIKDGKHLSKAMGTLKPGSQFGESSVLFNDPAMVKATIIASKASPKTGKIVLYHLDGDKFREKIDPEELKNLQMRITEIMGVFDILSGIDDKIVGKGTIIRPYEPSGWWLIKQWRGTILQYVWKYVLGMMAFTAVLGVVFGAIQDPNSIGLGMDLGDDSDTAMGSALSHLEEWWVKLQPLATFVTTFFLAEAFKFWRGFYNTARAFQGRFNDISLLIASTAARGNDGKLTAGALRAIEDIAHLQRLLHVLYWSSLVKRFNALGSPEGISYFLSLNQIKKEEYDSLRKATSKGIKGYHASITWLCSRIWFAQRNGDIEADPAAMSRILGNVEALRGLMKTIEDMYDGRAPLAYVHFVYLLVTTIIGLSPFALFSMLDYWSIPAVGLLTLFYWGIFRLCLMFFDPVDNDKRNMSYEESSGFDVSVLIREANEASLCFSGSADIMPEIYLPNNSLKCGGDGD